MKNILINKKKLTILIVALVLVVTGVSYAFMGPIFSGNGTETVLTSGVLELTISDGDENISGGLIGPNITLTKTFSVKNTGNVATVYDLYLSEVYNTFIDKEHLVYELISINGCNKEETQAPSNSSKIGDTCAIDVGDTHNYTLNITFKNDPDHNQSENIGKQFGGKLKLNEVRDLRVTYNYFLDGNSVSEIPNQESSELIIETSSCNNGAIINYDNNSKEYSIGNITKDSVCNLYFRTKTYNVEIVVDSNTTTLTNIIEVAYNNSNTVTITPASGYYLSSATCTNGYTTNATTGDNSTAAQEITISNNGNDNISTCTFNSIEIVPTSVTITNKPTNDVLKVGNTHTLGISISPNNANKNVTWSSSNTNVATINNNGTITARSTGTTTITVTTLSGNRTDSFTLKISNVSCSYSFTFNYYSNMCTSNSAKSYTLTITYNGADIGSQYSYRVLRQVGRETPKGSDNWVCSFEYQNRSGTLSSSSGTITDNYTEWYTSGEPTTTAYIDGILCTKS